MVPPILCHLSSLQISSWLASLLQPQAGKAGGTGRRPDTNSLTKPLDELRNTLHMTSVAMAAKLP